MTNSNLIVLSKEAEKNCLSRLQARWNQPSNEQQSTIEELYKVCLSHGVICPVDKLINAF